jgi:hypothetical protein
LAAHDAHVDAPAATVQLPPGQVRHEVALANGAYDPAAHCEQVPELTELEKVPALHAVHGVVVVMDMPAGHGGPVLSTQVSVSPAPPVR